VITIGWNAQRSFVNKRYADEIDAMYRDRAVA